MSISDNWWQTPERQEILDAYNSLQTNPPEVQEKTQKSTQWGPAGLNAQMTCGGDQDMPACSMWTQDEHSNYNDGHCSLGWRTFRRYQCNEWQPGADLPFTTDEQAGDEEPRWLP